MGLVEVCIELRTQVQNAQRCPGRNQDSVRLQRLISLSRLYFPESALSLHVTCLLAKTPCDSVVWAREAKCHAPVCDPPRVTSLGHRTYFCLVYELLLVFADTIAPAGVCGFIFCQHPTF